jgi:hypothetical protein
VTGVKNNERFARADKANGKRPLRTAHSSRHLPLIYTKALSCTFFYRSFSEKHQKQKLVNQRLALTGWKNCQYIHAKAKDSFSKQITCLGFKIVFAYKYL